jgi:hypothetical protein
MPNEPAPPSRRDEIDTFLKQRRLERQAAPSERGRLIFALDATASREPMWDLARQLQGEMFNEVAAIGSLDVQLVYYRGSRECSHSQWVSDARSLAGLMETIECRSGHTQIGRVLDHAAKENARQKVSALVFVGDCCEETPADLYAAARELQVPVFLFQEGDDPVATEVFKEIKHLTKGAHCRFDPGAADQLRDLLRAVAAFAAGGLKALSARRDAGAVKLLQQLK